MKYERDPNNIPLNGRGGDTNNPDGMRLIRLFLYPGGLKIWDIIICLKSSISSLPFFINLSYLLFLFSLTLLGNFSCSEYAVAVGRIVEKIRRRLTAS